LRTLSEHATAHRQVAFSTAAVVRAARVLARLGPEACEAALQRITELGFRDGNAVIHALATAPRASVARLEPRLVSAAMEHTLGRAEGLTRAHDALAPGLTRTEIQVRVGEVADRMLDLAAVLGDRKLVARARAGMLGDARMRGNALELLENILPRAAASRTVALLEWARDGAKVAGGQDGARLDAWLSLCVAFDSGKLAAGDPMLPILERLTLLRESTLFQGLAGEEIYPVAEMRISAFNAGSPWSERATPGRRSSCRNVRVSRRSACEIGRGATLGEMALPTARPGRRRSRGHRRRAPPDPPGGVRGAARRVPGARQGRHSDPVGPPAWRGVTRRAATRRSAR
jgi:hypothetical protein